MTPDKHLGSPYPILLSAAFVVSAATAFQTLGTLVLPDYLAGAGHYQFLTNIALCFSTAYFALNVCYHTLRLTALAPAKVYLSATCFSLNFIVSLVYWSLKLFVPQLIISEKDTFPFSLDIKIHLLPLLCSTVDYLCFMQRWDVPYLSGYAIVATLTTLYWFWLEYLIADDAAYPYPFLNVDKNLRIVIFLIVSLLAFASFCVGKLIHPEFIPKLERAEEDYAKTK